MFAKVCCRDKIVTCCSWTRDVEKALEILEVGGVHSTLCQIRRETQQADAIQVCGLIGYQLCGPVTHEQGVKSQQIAASRCHSDPWCHWLSTPWTCRA